MTQPEGARFIKTHEYILPDGTVGISQHATEQLGDVVFVELPAVGATLSRGQSFGVVESVKAVSDLYAPVDGTVLAVNAALIEEPGLVSEEPFGRGWMLKLAPADPAQLSSAELMDAEAYAAFAAAH